LGRLEDNLNHHGECLKKASAEGIDLVIFPELSLTGYLLKDLVPEVALSREAFLEKVGEKTQEVRNLEAVIGFVEETPRHRFHNSAAVLRWDDQGTIELVHVHRKVYLPTYGLFDEGRYFSAGRTVRTFDTLALDKCGLLICEDAWHLSLPLLLALDGPELEGAGALIVISNSPARGVGAKAEGVPESHQVWESLLKTYATLLEVAVIYANRAGVEDGLTFSGGSQILAPGGEMLARANLIDPARLDFDFDWPELLRANRIGSQVFASENVDLLKRELNRIQRCLSGPRSEG
jgi:predicted amidohydrolase